MWKNLEIKPHAIMIAVPFQGHLTPFVHLALKLASSGFTVTFAHTEHVHHVISKSHQNSNNTAEFDIFSEARSSGLDIRYTTIFDGFPLEFDRDLNAVEYWENMLFKFPALADEFVGEIIESLDPSSVPLLVADTVACWPGKVALKYNLVNVSFWTQPVLGFAVSYHLELLRENGHFPPKENCVGALIDYIPGVEPIRTKDLMSYFQETDITTVVHKLIFMAFEEVRKADFILCNIVQELELETLAALNLERPIYAIGPLNFSTKIDVSKNLLTEIDCSKWLDSKPTGSVLYVSFGSIVQTNKQIIEEIAKGLLLSEVNFIWAIRHNIVGSINDTDVLMDEFKDKIKNRLIVPWCNQNTVLSHSAVGGFLTHCGWNSIMEGIWCGVPMICYPIAYDQPSNRKLLVDDWKIGINLCDEISVNGDEVAEKIKRLMSSETSDCIRHEMGKVRNIVHNALAEDGSSQRNFDQFLEDLRDKIVQYGLPQDDN